MHNYLKKINEKRFIFFEIGLIISLGLALFAFNWRIADPYADIPFVFDAENERIEQINLPTPPTRQYLLPPPPQQIVPTQPLSGNIVTVLEQSFQETQMASTEINSQNDVAAGEGIFGETNDLPPDQTQEAEIFVLVEEMPQFPGGDQALLQYLADKIRYPAIARENKIEGLVVVQFVIDENGTISQAQILRGIGGGCDEEALRVIAAMPRWKPGKQRGIPVKVRFNLPVRFQLKTS